VWSLGSEWASIFFSVYGTVSAISPDDKKLLSLNDNQITEYSIETGKEIKKISGHVEEVTSAVYSPDGSKILSAAKDYMIKEWSVIIGECLQTFFKGKELMAGVNEDIYFCPSAVYSMGGESVLSIFGDGIGNEWSIRTGKCLKIFHWKNYHIRKVFSSGNGEKILISASNGILTEWSVLTGECLQTFTGHHGEIINALYSPGTKKILSVSHNAIKEWFIETGTCLHTIACEDADIKYTFYTLDGKRILDTNGGTTKEWSVKTGKSLRAFPGYAVHCPDNSKILTIIYNKKPELLICSAETGEFLKKLDTPFGIPPKFSPDGKKFALVFKNHIKEYSTDTFDITRIFDSQYFLNEIIYSFDSKKILAYADDRLIVWSAETGEQLKIIETYTNKIKLVGFTSDSENILIFLYDDTKKSHTAEMWKIKTTEFLYSIELIKGAYGFPLISKDGDKFLFIVIQNGLVHEYSVETGKCMRTFESINKQIKPIYSADGSKVVFSREPVEILSVRTGQLFFEKSEVDFFTTFTYNGKRFYDGFDSEWSAETGEFIRKIKTNRPTQLALNSRDGKNVLYLDDAGINLYSSETGDCLLKISDGYDFKAIYSPDESKILSWSSSWNDGIIKEWPIKNNERIRTFSGHTEGCITVIYSPDGKKILSASEDRTIREWSLETGNCLKVLRGHRSRVENARYSSDGKKIWSASSESVKEWAVETGQCLQSFVIDKNSCRCIYRPDDNSILVVLKDGVVAEYFFDPDNPARFYDDGGSLAVTAIYSPDGKKILIGCIDGTLKEWSTSTFECSQFFDGHFGCVRRVIYSADGNKIFAEYGNNMVKEWSAETRKCLNTRIAQNIIYAALCQRAFLITYDEVNNAMLLRTWCSKLGGWLSDIVVSDVLGDQPLFSLDSRLFLVQSRETIGEYCVETGECLQKIEISDRSFRLIAYCAESKKVLIAFKSETLEEWSIETGACLYKFDISSYLVKSAVYIAKGNKIFIVYYNGIVEEWSTCQIFVKADEHRFILHFYDGMEQQISFSPDNKTNELIIIDSMYPLSYWKTNRYGSQECIENTAYSNDSRKVTLTYQNGNMIEWLLDTNKCSQIFEESNTEMYLHPVYSIDGKKLLAAFGNLTREWSAETGAIIQEFINEPGIFPQSVDFRHLHPSSIFTEDEKERLRRYGAIFNDEDEKCWKEAVEDAYGDDDEPG